MSKNGLFLTLNGSCVLSMRPVFIFSCRGFIISRSIHCRRILKSHSPTGCAWIEWDNYLISNSKNYFSSIIIKAITLNIAVYINSILWSCSMHSLQNHTCQPWKYMTNDRSIPKHTQLFTLKLQLHKIVWERGINLLT